MAAESVQRSVLMDAIRLENNLAIMDYEKCTNCGQCAEKCPTGTIEYSESTYKSNLSLTTVIF